MVPATVQMAVGHGRRTARSDITRRVKTPDLISLPFYMFLMSYTFFFRWSLQLVPSGGPVQTRLTQASKLIGHHNVL